MTEWFTLHEITWFGFGAITGWSLALSWSCYLLERRPR